jgi:hypothetical protein
MLQAWKELKRIYGQSNEVTVGQIERELNNLPTATNAAEVLELLDNMNKLQAELNNYDSKWTDRELKTHATAKIDCQAFDAVLEIINTESTRPTVWIEVDAQIRNTADRKTPTPQRKTPTKGQPLSRLSDDNAYDASQSINGYRQPTHQRSHLNQTNGMRVMTCKNCYSTDHLIKECKLGVCRSCYSVGRSDHNPIDCLVFKAMVSRGLKRPADGGGAVHKRTKRLMTPTGEPVGIAAVEPNVQQELEESNLDHDNSVKLPAYISKHIHFSFKIAGLLTNPNQ